MRFKRSKRPRRQNVQRGIKLGFETLETRALLSATPVEIDTAGLLPSILQDIPKSAIPAALAGKVDEHYWRLAEQISRASKQGALTGEALQAALAALSLGDPQVAPVNGAAEIRTLINTLDTTAKTIGQLESIGARLDAWQFEVGGSAFNNNELYAWVPAQLADDLAELPVVRSVSLPVNAVTDVGSVTTAGDSLLKADQGRSMLGVDGTGVKVGVISSGVPNRSTAQSSGDLPAIINIDPTRSGSQSDNEGTGMLEIIHDLAPGASLYFSGYRLVNDGMGNLIEQFTTTDMVDSINWLVSQGVKVIVDDIQFFNEPAFTDGIVAQAAASAVSQGVTFVTAAGNRADRHYQGQFSNDGFGRQDFKLGASVDNILNVNVAPQKSVEAWLHWSDPLLTSANNYDIRFVDLSTGLTIGTQGNSNQNGTGGDDNPIERATWTNTSSSTVQVGIVVQKISGADRELEIYITPNGAAADDDATITDSLFGHKAVDSVISAGAIDVADSGTDTPEAYSSRGPSTIYTNFSTQTKTMRNSLDGMGVDGGNTATYGTDIPGDADSYPNFFGTSAAAPHVAGIAALLLSANPSLTPAQVSSALTSTAVDIDASGYDGNTGYGRFDAYKALTSILPPKVTNVIISSTAAGLPSFSFNNPNDDAADFDGSGIQLRTVPVGGVNQVSLQFSEPVTNISVSSLTMPRLLFGGTPLTPVSYGYDPVTYTATWTFSGPAPADWYIASLVDTVTDTAGNQLDGEWTNPFSTSTSATAGVSHFPSGNGVAGGAFYFVATILPGDANLDNVVDGADFLIWQVNNGGSGKSFGQGDFTGDGLTNSSDLSLYQANSGKNLQKLSLADFNADGVVDTADRAIWQANNGTTGDHTKGDADNDGDVDGNDFTIWQRQLGYHLTWVA